jgi:hypothetical protein
MFIRQIIGSGSRGRFVLRIYLSIVLMVALLFGCVFILGHHKDISSVWGGIAALTATLYLHSRIDKK